MPPRRSSTCGHVEGAVADRDVIEAVGREVLPHPVIGAVGGQVKQRPGKPDLRANGLRDDWVAEVSRPLADNGDDQHNADQRHKQATSPRAARSAACSCAPLGRTWRGVGGARIPGGHSSQKPLGSGSGEQREEQGGECEDPPRHPHPVPPRGVVVQQPVGIARPRQAEAHGEHIARHHADQQADAQSPRIHRRKQARQRADRISLWDLLRGVEIFNVFQNIRM